MNLIYHSLVRNADEEGRDQIDTALNAGEPGVSKEESAEEFEARRAAEMAAFEASARNRASGG